MKNARRISQGLFLLLFLFLFLQTESKGLDELGYPVKIFLDFAPLIFITTLLAASVLGMQLSGIADPLSLLIRSFSISINPLFNYGTNAFFESIYNLDSKTLSTVSEPVYALLKKSLLSFQQPRFIQGTFIRL